MQEIVARRSLITIPWVCALVWSVLTLGIMTKNRAAIALGSAGFALLALLAGSAHAGMAHTDARSAEFIRINTGRNHFVDQHNLHNYAEMRNRGLVDGGADYNKLHPFVRRNWSQIMRGEIPVLGLIRNLDNGASATRDGHVQLGSAEALRGFDSWLRGTAGQPPGAIRFAPAAAAKPSPFGALLTEAAVLDGHGAQLVAIAAARELIATHQGPLGFRVLTEVMHASSGRAGQRTDDVASTEARESVVTMADGAILRTRIDATQDGLAGLSLMVERDNVRHHLGFHQDHTGAVKVTAAVARREGPQGEWKITEKELPR
jgi:hypothetical protein